MIGGANSLGSSCGGQDFLVNKIRKIPHMPFRVLDAPHLCDDFYLNLMDWSAENALGVALDRSVYIWNANTESVTELVRLPELNQVTSVAWSQQGKHLSVGTLDGQLQIWDVNKQKLVRTMRGHTHRVGACAWSNSLVASGSKDKSILVRDVRSPSEFTQQLNGHR
jgi:cell division cycle 20-like protein 1 (cofactor of APC complex)